jgi:hypothetical protein
VSVNVPQISYPSIIKPSDEASRTGLMDKRRRFDGDSVAMTMLEGVYDMLPVSHEHSHIGSMDMDLPRKQKDDSSSTSENVSSPKSSSVVGARYTQVL